MPLGTHRFNWPSPMVEGAVDIIHMVVFVLAMLWVLSQLVVTRDFDIVKRPTSIP
jgi:hypothetical protein